MVSYNNIYGTEKQQYKFVLGVDYFQEGDIIMDGCSECKILYHFIDDLGHVHYTTELPLDEDDLEIAINHFKMLMKYNLVVKL